MSTELFYCNTIFGVSPPSDINPLILQRYRGKKILVLCCREGQLIRLRRLQINPETLLLACGWWDAKEAGIVTEEGFLNKKELLNWDVVVILCRERIQDLYLPLLLSIEDILGRSRLIG